MGTLARNALSKHALNDLTQLVGELTSSHKRIQISSISSDNMKAMERYAIPPITDIFYEVQNEDARHLLPIRMTLLDWKIISNNLVPLLKAIPKPPEPSDGDDYAEYKPLKRWAKCGYQIVRLLAVLTSEIPEENVNFTPGCAMEKELLIASESLGQARKTLVPIVLLLRHYLQCRAWKQGKLMPSSSHRVEDARIENILKLIRNLLLNPGGRTLLPLHMDLAKRALDARRRILSSLKKAELFDLLGIVLSSNSVDENYDERKKVLDVSLRNDVVWLAADVYGLACDIRSFGTPKVEKVLLGKTTRKLNTAGKRWGTRNTGGVVLSGRMAGSSKRIVMSTSAIEKEKNQGIFGRLMKEGSEMMSLLLGNRKERRLSRAYGFEEKFMEEFVNGSGFNLLTQRLLQLLTVNKGLDDDAQLDIFLRFVTGSLRAINTKTARKVRKETKRGKKQEGGHGVVMNSEVFAMREAIGEESFKVVIKGVADAIENKAHARVELATAALKEMMTMLSMSTTTEQKPETKAKSLETEPKMPSSPVTPTLNDIQEDEIQPMDIVFRKDQIGPKKSEPKINPPQEKDIGNSEHSEKEIGPQSSTSTDQVYPAMDSEPSEKDKEETDASPGLVKTPPDQESAREFALNTLERVLEDGLGFTGSETKGYGDILSLLVREFDAKAYSWTHLANIVELIHAFVEMLSDNELNDVVVKKKRKKKTKKPASKPDRKSGEQRSEENAIEKGSSVEANNGSDNSEEPNAEKGMDDEIDHDKETPDITATTENDDGATVNNKEGTTKESDNIDDDAEQRSNRREDTPEGNSDESPKEGNDGEQESPPTFDSDGESDLEDEDEYFASVSSDSIIRKFAHGRAIENLVLVLRCALTGITTMSGGSVAIPQGADALATPAHARKTFEILQRIWKASSDVERGVSKGCFFTLSTLHLLCAIMSVSPKELKVSGTLMNNLSLFAQDITSEFFDWLSLSPSLTVDSLALLEKGTCGGYKITANDIKLREREKLGLPIEAGKRKRKKTQEDDSESEELEVERTTKRRKRKTADSESEYSELSSGGESSGEEEVSGEEPSKARKRQPEINDVDNNPKRLRPANEGSSEVPSDADVEGIERLVTGAVKETTEDKEKRIPFALSDKDPVASYRQPNRRVIVDDNDDDDDDELEVV